MKTKIKQERGITLIALVITIVVLLILAGVSVNALFGDNGIIEKAKDAQNKMNEAQQKDLNSINELDNWLNEQTRKPWTQNKTTVTNGTTTYTVGDDYTYNCGVSGYTGGWKVLGAENGKLLIMSTVDVGILGLKGTSGDGTTSYGYTNGIAKLNEMCEPYGTNARSITVEDINRVTGYIPEHQTISITSENKYYYDNDTANQSSTVTGTYAAYAGKYGLATALGIVNNNPVTGNARYGYYPNTLTDSRSGDTVGIATNSSAYEMIFGKYSDIIDQNGNKYWLASSYVDAHEFDSYLGMCYVEFDGRVASYSLWLSGEGAHDTINPVRAVVPVE